MAKDKDIEEMMKEAGFLPDGYEVPAGRSNYMKFETGENKFRILNSPILGYEGWKTEDDGTRKPLRVRMNESLPVEELDNPEETKHFWAMCVWDYKTKAVKILEITQKGILRTVKALSKDKDWGSPLNYDLSVVKEGEKMNTTYQVIPMPPKPLDSEAKEAWDEVKDKIELNALYSGKDPFEALKK